MDKDLKNIKEGKGLSESNTSNNHSQSGTRLEQRGLVSGNKGLRIDQYTLNNEKNQNDHFADVHKMGTMSLTLALIILDRLNTTERIDVARDNLAEAVQVVSAAAKYRIPQKPVKSISFWGILKTTTCPTCKYGVLHGFPKFCSHCGQALDWSDKK